MDTRTRYARIHLTMDKVFNRDILDCLAAIGLGHLSAEAGRTMLLKQNMGLKRVFGGETEVVEDTVATYSFLVRPEQEADLMNHLIQQLGLDHPGRGSIHSREVELAASVMPPPPLLNLGHTERRVMATELMGITCITQKGEGNLVAEIGLHTGTSVPTVSYGIGTGLRNRLGLWRILIPAEKEVCTLILDAEDADTVMDMMISAGQLDQPGKGFIHLFPVRQGFLNTRFYDGSTSQAASIEQIVSAIDEIKGDTQWRRKALSQGSGKGKGRRFLENLVNVTLECNEGQADRMVQVAMAAGAAGATISLVKHVDLGGGGGTGSPNQAPAGQGAVSPARESCIMTIGPLMVDPVIAALLEAGLLDPEVSGELSLNPVPRACTFLGK